MLWLLACTAAPPLPPSITLPISPPPALYATAVSAAEFVGPLDVVGLDPAVLCEGRDRAALLRSGHFGWRVLVLGRDGVQPFDRVIPPDAPPKTASGMTAERIKAWAAA